MREPSPLISGVMPDPAIRFPPVLLVQVSAIAFRA